MVVFCMMLLSQTSIALYACKHKVYYKIFHCEHHQLKIISGAAGSMCNLILARTPSKGFLYLGWNNFPHYAFGRTRRAVNITCTQMRTYQMPQQDFKELVVILKIMSFSCMEGGLCEIFGIWGTEPNLDRRIRSRRDWIEEWTERAGTG